MFLYSPELASTTLLPALVPLLPLALLPPVLLLTPDAVAPALFPLALAPETIPPVPSALDAVVFEPALAVLFAPVLLLPPMLPVALTPPVLFAPVTPETTVPLAAELSVPPVFGALLPELVALLLLLAVTIRLPEAPPIVDELLAEFEADTLTEVT